MDSLPFGRIATFEMGSSAPSLVERPTNMNRIRYKIVKNSRLLEEWEKIFNVDQWRPILEKYLSPEDVEFCCSRHEDRKCQLQRVQDHLIQTKNNDLFEDILQCCSSQCNALHDLHQSLQMEDANEEDQTDTFSWTKRRLLQNRKSNIKPKLLTALDFNTVNELFKRHSQADADQEAQSFEEAIELLFSEMCVFKPLYHDLVKSCSNQRDHFAKCVRFMTVDSDVDLMKDEPMEALLREIKSQISDGTEQLMNQLLDLAILNQREQTLETEEIVSNVRMRLSDNQTLLKKCLFSIMEIQKKLGNETLERKMEESEERLETSIKDLDIRMMQHICAYRYQPLPQPPPRDEMAGPSNDQLYPKLPSENDTITDQFHDLNNQIKSVESANDLRIIDLQKQINIQQDEIEKLKRRLARVPPFIIPSSPEMQRTQKDYKINGLSVIHCDVFGNYPEINWQSQGRLKWLDRWAKMLSRKINYSPPIVLMLPPVLLPVEYGGFLVALALFWNNNKLEMRGRLPDECDINLTAPTNIKIHLKIQLRCGENILVDKTNVFELFKSNVQSDAYKTLFEVEANMDAQTPLPTALVQVLFLD